MNELKKIRKAVIPAAGFGTRFLPATKATPKEMLPIVDKPTIQFIVEEALASGIEEILIISGHAKRAIEDHFDSAIALEIELEKKHKDDLLKIVRDTAEIRVHYIRQKHMRGLGDAVYCAKPFIGDEPFAVLLGDDVVYSPNEPVIKQLMDVYYATGSSVLGCQIVPLEQISAYGSVDGEEVEIKNYGKIVRAKSMIEKPTPDEAPSQLAVLGRYIVKPEIFDIIENTPPGKGGEIQFTDSLNILAHQSDVYACNFKGQRYDLGDKLGFLKANVEFALRHEELHDEFLNYLKQLVTSL